MKLEIELSDQAYQELTNFLDEYTQENKGIMEPWLYDRLTMLRDKLHAAVAEYSAPSCDNCNEKGAKFVPDPCDIDCGQDPCIFTKTLCKKCAVEEFHLVTEQEFEELRL